MPKVQKEKTVKPLRHNPLADEIKEAEDTYGLRKTPRTKLRKNAREQGEEEESAVLPANITKKVLEVVQAQNADEDIAGGIDFSDMVSTGGTDGGESDSEGADVEVDADGYVVAEGLNEEEERALSLFMPSTGAPKPGPTLADLILGKIAEHEAKKAKGADQQSVQSTTEGLSPKVIEVYGEIGKWLKHYKTGKLPKAFKVLPSLANWEEVLTLTNPLGWSPAAMHEAVKIFASGLNPRMAQRFYNLVLLPAVRQDVAEHKRLNFHYFRSLRKSVFKPAAFFKGIVLPLAAENCTLREALILSAVLSKASIPAMHVSACIVRLCEMTPWYGTTSILLAALVNKKCALHLRVVESLVAHFCAFAGEERALPLVWHRALLIFVQRYKYDLDDDQRRRVKELLRVHFHEAVGVEIRRELLAPRPGEVPAASQTGVAPMDVG